MASETYSFIPPPEIRDAAQELVDAYSQVTALPNSSDDEDDDDAHDREGASVNDEDAEDEFYVDPIWRHTPTESKMTLKQPRHCPIIQPKLRTLIHALYSELPPPGKYVHATHRVLIRCLIMSSISINGDWKNSSGITQMTAALSFGGRLTMHDKMVDGLRQNPTTTIHG